MALVLLYNIHTVGLIHKEIELQLVQYVKLPMHQITYIMVN